MIIDHTTIDTPPARPRMRSAPEADAPVTYQFKASDATHILDIFDLITNSAMKSVQPGDDPEKAIWKIRVEFKRRIIEEVCR